MATTLIDIMVGERFFAQVKYNYLPIFPIHLEDMEKFCIEKYPSLKNKQFTLAFSENRVK